MNPFEWVFVSDVGAWADGLRWVNMIVWTVTSALLLRLYLDNKTGRMGWKAAYGSVGAFLTIALAQPVALTRDESDIGAIPILVLVFGVMSFLGTWEVTHVTLFRPRKEP